MCGVVGIVGRCAVHYLLYESLSLLQHRGQDSAGIITHDQGKFYRRKANGLVRDVFRQQHMDRLQGNMGIGHVRYPTKGSNGTALVQPLYVNFPYGICLAHNGNLTNTHELVQDLLRTGRRHLNTVSDSEILLNVFADELYRCDTRLPIQDIVFSALRKLYQRCRGAYAVVVQIAHHGMVAFRDPHGIRPLIQGQRETNDGLEYIFASESSAIDALGFTVTTDIQPGEAVFIDVDGNRKAAQCATNPQHAPCIFEHIYLARPDSIIDNISVYKTRLRQGQHLAQQLARRQFSADNINVVIPVPDTGRIVAHTLALSLDIPFREGLVKNRYVGRTFIMPSQNQRINSVRRKLNVIDLECAGKNVLLVDDSIVRGTTARQIVNMVRAAGAKKVFFASAAPPVCYPNVYGIDMPVTSELVAGRYHHMDKDKIEREVAQFIGADRLIFQELDGLIESSQAGNRDIQRFECSVFDGYYVTQDIDDDYLTALAGERTADRGHHDEDTLGIMLSTEEG